MSRTFHRRVRRLAGDLNALIRFAAADFVTPPYVAAAIAAGLNRLVIDQHKAFDFGAGDVRCLGRHGGYPPPWPCAVVAEAGDGSMTA